MRRFSARERGFGMVFATAALVFGLSGTVSVRAQDLSGTPGSPQPRHLHHTHGNERAQAHNAHYRGLTITQPPDVSPDDDIMVDGPIRYGDIRDFDPDPYVDGGVQYPFGLDGIGGFGSDVGFSAGADSAVYARRR